MIILGIDPGTSIIGFGVIKKDGGKLSCREYGCIKTIPITSDIEKISVIEKELTSLIKRVKPDQVSVEKLFFFKNAKTVISVAQARGVILSVCAQNDLCPKEFTPLQIKQAVSCYGRANKSEVQKMVKLILGLNEIPKPDDAADALASAICCANFTR